MNDNHHDEEDFAALFAASEQTRKLATGQTVEGTIAVDTHVFRVGNRTGLSDGKTPEEVEQQLMRITPQKYLHGAHHWLILHGRYTCIARKPECPRCVIADICLYRDKTPAIASTKKRAPSGAKSKKR